MCESEKKAPLQNSVALKIHGSAKSHGNQAFVCLQGAGNVVVVEIIHERQRFGQCFGRGVLGAIVVFLQFLKMRERMTHHN